VLWASTACRARSFPDSNSLRHFDLSQVWGDSAATSDSVGVLDGGQAKIINPIIAGIIGVFQIVRLLLSPYHVTIGDPLERDRSGDQPLIVGRICASYASRIEPPFSRKDPSHGGATPQATAPNTQPTPAVTAIASAPQNATRNAPTRADAPPA
jgi:hypothetical protein